QVSTFAGPALAGVIIEAAHGHTTGAGVTVDYQLHDRRRLAEFAVAIEFFRSEDTTRADNVGVVFHAQSGRVAVAVGDVSGFDVTALDQLLDHFLGADIQAGIGDADLALADACHGFHHGDGITLVEKADQLAGVDQAGDIAGAIHLGRALRRINQHRRSHRVATGHRGLRADQRQQLTVGTGTDNTVQRIVRIVAGIVFRTRRN